MSDRSDAISKFNLSIMDAQCLLNLMMDLRCISEQQYETMSNALFKCGIDEIHEKD